MMLALRKMISYITVEAQSVPQWLDLERGTGSRVVAGSSNPTEAAWKLSWYATFIARAEAEPEEGAWQ